jgi:D-arabinan exo alpha-(1,3)/(1,5)-arabinofuranosidase (non-reducing end)
MRAVRPSLLLFLAFIPLNLLAQKGAPPDLSPPSTQSPGAVESVDLRPTFERLGLAPRQQGDRPTCSVFTISGAVEFAVARRQGHTPRLSVEFLNWAADKVRGDTADGGFFSDLWKGFSAYGICSEADMPYESKLDPERSPSAAALADAKVRLSLGLRLHWIKGWNVNTGLSTEEITAIKRTLERGWPVCGGLRWPKQEKWVENVLQMCSADAVRDGHSVLLVGYRDDPAQPGGGVFLFRNTSGSGQDGSMPYGYAHEYMNDAVWIDYAQRKEAHSGTSTPSALFSDPLGALATLSAGRNRRISSNEQPKWNDANLDMTVLPPGKALEMPALEGPGMITHIWFTSHAGRVNELNALSLRIYWDGRKEPGVEVPLGEFFAVGQGKPASVESVPVQVSPSGALSCYWRMPFAKSARIVVANDNPNRSTGLYWQVDWVELDNVSPETPYFHAQYREEYPAVAGHDYLIADLEGSGKYIGTVMSVTLAQDGWWGEGDDFFYIDGEEVPSLQGTGSEDYFNDAWGFRPRTSQWFGQPRWEGDNAGDSGVCYRWHVLDPVGFSKSLKVAIEHKGNRAEDIEGFYIERPDFINSVAFWYQIGEPKRFGALPPYPERSVPWQTRHLVQAFRQAKVTGRTKVQVETSGMFGARPVLSWTNSELGARLRIPFQVGTNGRYALRLTAAAAPEFGRYDIELDNKTAVRSADFRSRDEEELDLGLGTHELTAGEHTLSFVALPNGGGMAQPLAVELLRLLRLPPEATRSVKTHHEAHFIRLGIGRAVYAYRLAYGEVPDSLETLVTAELMPARYLADENGKPLRSHREGDSLIVESTGVEPWTYRWQGLDARR